MSIFQDGWCRLLYMHFSNRFVHVWAAIGILNNDICRKSEITGEGENAGCYRSFLSSYNVPDRLLPQCRLNKDLVSKDWTENSSMLHRNPNFAIEKVFFPPPENPH